MKTKRRAPHSPLPTTPPTHAPVESAAEKAAMVAGVTEALSELISDSTGSIARSSLATAPAQANVVPCTKVFIYEFTDL